MTLMPEESRHLLFNPRERSLSRLLDEIEATETMDELVGAFAKLPSEFGFDFQLCIHRGSYGRQAPPDRVLTTLPEPTRERMLQNSFLSDHPVVKKIREGQSPVYFPIDVSPGQNVGIGDGSEGTARDLYGVAFAVTYQSG